MKHGLHGSEVVKNKNYLFVKKKKIIMFVSEEGRGCGKKVTSSSYEELRSLAQGDLSKDQGLGPWLGTMHWIVWNLYL